MAATVVITRTGNSTAVKLSDTRTKVFNSPPTIDVNSRNGQTVISGASFYKSEVLNINGAAPQEAHDDYVAQLQAAFPDASISGGVINFAALDGAWDGSDAYVSLSADTYILTTANPKLGRWLKVKQDVVGGWALFINGIDQDVDVAPEAVTILQLFKDDEGVYFTIKCEAYTLVGAPDATRPEPVSFTIEDADPTDVIVPFGEDLDESSVPAGSDFSSLLGKTFTVDVTGDTLTLIANTAYENGDEEQIVYTPGVNPLRDLSRNAALAFDSADFGDVVNNIAP